MATLTRPKTTIVSLSEDRYNVLLAHARRAGTTPDEAASAFVEKSLAEVEERQREIERRDRIMDELVAETERLGLYAPRAILDACVLYPPTLRDLLMRLASGLLFAPRFTDAIHEEWIRNVLRDYADITRPKLERTRDLMNAIDPDSLVTGYERRIAGLTLPDPDDRHVLAAALETQAPVIVTFNLRHFPKARLQPLGVLAQHPDDSVCGLFDADPSAVVARVARLRESLKRPPHTAEEILETFLRNGLTRFAGRLQNHLGEF